MASSLKSPLENGLTRLPALRSKGLLNDQVSKQIFEAGRKLKFAEAPVNWNQVVDSYEQTGEVSRDDLKLLRDFTKAADKARKELQKELKGQEKVARRDINRLRALDAYLEPASKLQEAYIEATSRAALAAVAGASFGPTATVAAYLAWNPAPVKRVESLVDHLKQLQAGTSPLLHQGNDVKPVHQEELWQTKMQMLQQAAESARQGNPVEIDVQYFEMTSSSFVSKLAEAAQAGCPVRVNIDPSRPRHDDNLDMRVDDGPRKLRALLQLTSIPDANVGVSIFPVVAEMGSINDLMHRKLLRVGDQVLLGGMNANEGSGENVDNGYLIKGPAARELMEGFQADIERSKGASLADVYGQKMVDSFGKGAVALTPHGLATVLDAMSGPSPAGVRIASKPSMEEIQKLAKDLKVNLSELVSVTKLEENISRGSTRPLALKPAGKKILNDLIQRSFQQVEEKKNQERLNVVALPAGEKSGQVTVALGDTSEEREALILQAIASAEKFVYVPTFVLTKAIARALVARRDELAEQGKTLDMRVVMDAGMYGYGGTPNEEGYLTLEDAGVPVRWSLLTRAQMDHDRKIHAKQILTDKMELVGSNNLSNKGIRDNWELNGLVMFDPQVPQAMEAQKEGVDRFLELWENESIALDTRAASEMQNIDELGIEDSRKRSIRTFLGAIANYETQSAKFIEEQLQNPTIAARAAQLHSTGMAWGYARLEASKEVLGDDFYKALRELPTSKKLFAFAVGEASE